MSDYETRQLIAQKQQAVSEALADLLSVQVHRGPQLRGDAAVHLSRRGVKEGGAVPRLAATHFPVRLASEFVGAREAF